jgi:hypothetical protein
MAPDEGDSELDEAASDAWSEANARVWSKPPDEHLGEADSHAAPVEIASLPWQHAFLLAGSLRSAGIETFLDPPDPPTAFAFGGMLRRPYHVLVRAADAEEARAIAAEVSPE